MKQTYQTKIRNSILEKDKLSIIDYLNEYSKYFCMVERKMFVDLTCRGKSQGSIKSEYLKKFNINARQFNGIAAQVRGKIDSIKALKDLEIEEKNSKIESKQKQLVDLEEQKIAKFNRLNSLKMNDKRFGKALKQYRNTKRKIHNTKRKIQKLKHKVDSLETDKFFKKVRICFGSKELFRKQHLLKENNLKNHKDWLNLWKTARSSQCMFIGSSDETAGNLNCQYAQNNTIKITVADVFKEKYGEFIYIENIRFPYGQKYLDYARETYKKYSPSYNLVKYTKSPITYRFHKNEFGWYISATVTVDDREIVTDSRIGAIGVDFNANFISATFIDRFGNPLDEIKIKGTMFDRTSNQIDATLAEISKEVCNLAEYYRVPIVIEDLCFKGAKSKVDKNTKYKRMIGKFPYAKFRDSIKARASKLGIEVIVINPSYTSIIGQMKFMRKYGLSSHGAAACEIGRRGLGFTNTKVDSPRRSSYMTIKPKTKVNLSNYKLWMKLSTMIKKNFTFNDRLQSLYSNLI